MADRVTPEEQLSEEYGICLRAIAKCKRAIIGDPHDDQIKRRLAVWEERRAKLVKEITALDAGASK